MNTSVNSTYDLSESILFDSDSRRVLREIVEDFAGSDERWEQNMREFLGTATIPDIYYLQKISGGYYFDRHTELKGESLTDEEGERWEKLLLSLCGVSVKSIVGGKINC